MLEEKILSPRLEALKANLIGDIPAEAAARDELSALPLVRLIAIYLNWVDRLIAPRKRAVSFASGFFEKIADEEKLLAIRQWAAKVEAGQDLSDYLSTYTRTHGYSSRSGSRRGIKWADGRNGDRDFALNTMGVHHFHLVPAKADGSRPKGSRELIYARVERHSVHAVLLGDHNSFNDGSLRKAVAAAHYQEGLIFVGLTPARDDLTIEERQQLARKGVSTVETVADSVVPVGFSSSDGSAFEHVRHADRVAELIEYWEPLLDTPRGLADLRRVVPFGLSLDGLRWAFAYSDFGLFTTDKVFLSMLPWKR